MNYRYVVQELRHHRHRTLVNILGIGVGIALFVAINAVSTAYQEAVSLPFKNLGTDLVVQRPERRSADSPQTPATMRGIRLPFSNQLLSPIDLEKVGAIEGIDSFATALLLWEFDKNGFRTIMGVDPSQRGLGPVKVQEWIKEGRFPRQQGEILIEKHYAKFIHKQLDDTLELEGKAYRVVGLLEIREGAQIASANIYLPLSDAQSLMGGASGGVNVIYLRLKSPALLAPVKTEIAKTLNGVSVTSSDSFMELMGGVSRISDQFSFLASVIAFGGAAFLIIKTMLANLVERSREIGVMKAVGWTEKDIQKQLMGEAVVQSLLGGLGGILMGYALSFLLGFLSIPVTTPWEMNLVPAFAKTAEAATQSVRLPVSVSAGLSAVSLLLALAAGGLASYVMGKRAARVKPAEILRQL
jgi:ABC-type antimicrobial peptide transport system permease subunit